MKKAGTLEKKLRKAPNLPEQVDIKILLAQLDAYEKEKNILLALSNDITKVRERDDLAKVFSSRLKDFFYFSHVVVFLIDHQKDIFFPFLMDAQTNPIKDPDIFNSLLAMRYPLTDSVFKKIPDLDAPQTFLLDEVLDMPTIPLFISLNYEYGIREVMIAPLKRTMETFGYICIFSDRTNSFQDNFKSVLQGIAPHLSNAVSNIRANEEIAIKEEEKSMLLSLSDGIAALRSRNDLFQVVNTKLKALFSIKEFGIAQINEDHTYNSFVLDFESNKKTHPDFAKLTAAKYPVTDRVFSSIMNSEDLVIFDVNKLTEESEIPAYVRFWKSVGFRYVLGMALRVGGKIIGGAFFHFDSNEEPRMKTNLLKAVFAQLAVAVSNILANEQVLSYKQMLEVENDHLKEQIKTIYNFSDIIGSGPEMQKVYQMMFLVAESNTTVLLSGETGTGKELIARAIHNSSLRKNKLMVKVNCAALPANLIESELFGHEKGSFTGAIDRRIGKFELANHSTLFLDEIGEMPLETQVKLLRVIQERELERVGGTGTIKVNVRIIAATNRDLEEEVNEGRFRSELYYRLNVFPIVLPPLRNRLEDVAPLANYFLERYSKNTGRKVTAISLKAIRELKSYLWPGNVRELEHLIERSILLTQGNVLKEVQLPESRNKGENDRLNLSSKTLQELERSYIIEILKRCNGRIAGTAGAAELLDIPSTTLHSKMKKLSISKEDYFSRRH